MNLNTKVFVAIASLIPIGITIVLTQVSSRQPAFAQTQLQQCIRNLVSEGVSPDKAAEVCSQRPGEDTTKGPATECVEQEMYKTFQAESGPTPEGRWRYNTYNRPVDGQNVDFPGCELIRPFFKNASWRCPTQTMRVPVHSRTIAQALCSKGRACIDQQRFQEVRLRGDFLSEGRYAYGKQGDIPQNQMNQQGCTLTTVNNVQQWVCPVSSIRVKASTGVSTEDAARLCIN